MNNQSLTGASYSESRYATTEIQAEPILSERLEKAWSALGEALSNVRSINCKIFVPEPCACDNANSKIEGADTSNIESLICLIESLAANLENETREISGRI